MSPERNVTLSEAERIAWSKVYKVERLYALLQEENIELRREIQELRKELEKNYEQSNTHYTNHQ